MMERASRVGHICVVQVRICAWGKYFGTTWEERESSLSPGGYVEVEIHKMDEHDILICLLLQYIAIIPLACLIGHITC